MKKRLFVLSYTGYYNLGDDLMIDLIDEKKFPGFEILILSRREYYKKKIKYINRYNIIKYFIYIRKDDLLMNLEGTFQDRTGILSFFYYFIMNLIFLIKKGRIIFINTDFSDVKFNNIFINLLLKQSQLTVLRSRIEYRNYFKRFKNVNYSPDIVFLYKFGRLKKTNKKPYILISLREDKNIDQFLKFLHQTGCNYKFLLMNNENKFIKQVEEYFPEKDIFIYNYFNKDKVFNLIYNAEKIITMRYHIGIIGLFFNKEIGIINSCNKMKILNKDFGLSYVENRKKNIDKINKKGYINRNEIQRSWDGIIDKISALALI